MSEKTAVDGWEIDEAGFPATGSTADKLRFLLGYAVLAPSGHNTQPWLFRLLDDGVELYADRRRALPVVDPNDRELIISCGAALGHLRVAVAAFGHQPKVLCFPDDTRPDLLARVTLGPERTPTAEQKELARAIPARRTNRRPFADRPVPAPLLARLQDDAAEEHAQFIVIDGEDWRHEVADVVAEGDRFQAHDPRFRRELAAWLHPNRTRSRDGIPGYGFGLSDVMSYGMPLIIRTFDWGKGQAAKDRQLAAGSPVLAVLCTTDDTPTAWLACGQALSRVLLRARTQDVDASFLNQPIEVSELRPRLKEVIGLEQGFPQLLLRMGYGPDVPPTPRRPVADVLME